MNILSKIAIGALGLCLLAPGSYAAKPDPADKQTLKEARALQKARVKIAKNYSKLKKSAQKDGAIRLLVKLKPEGLSEDSKGSYKEAYKSLKKLTKKQGIKVKREIKTFGMVAVTANADQLDQLLDSELVQLVEQDHLNAPSLSDSVPYINTNAVWSYGYQGQGQAVAVLDTGFDTSHPFLAGNVVEEACFSTTDSISSTLCPNGQDEMFGLGAAADCTDTYGGTCAHGTHVAGIAAGNNGSLFGVAPSANLVLVNVFHYNHNMGEARAWDSDMIAGLEWVLNSATTNNIAAVNMSIGGALWDQPCDFISMASSITALRQAGIATVISAGNDSSVTSVSHPACVSDAITVASSLKYEDNISLFSNFSEQVDVVAPGSSIYSSIPDNQYSYYNGTSMAAPHVAGAFALLRNAFPSATVSEIESILESTGVPIYQLGADVTKPRVDILAAYASLGGNIDEATSYQAEEASWSDAVVETQHAGFTGAGYVNTTNVSGSWIEFTVDVDTAGDYQATMIYANGSAADRPMDVLVNGVTVTTAQTFPATAGWADWVGSASVMPLNAGLNTVRYVATSSAGAANLDRLDIAPLAGPNTPPVVANPVSDQTYYETLSSTTFWVGDIFFDADGDNLAITANSSDTGVIEVNMTGGAANPHLGLTPQATGSATITLSAFDGEATVDTSFNVTVLTNQNPIITNDPGDIVLPLGGAPITLDLNNVFSDPDGDPLTFDYEKSDDDNYNVTMPSASELLIDPQVEGVLSVYVTAYDGKSGEASVGFTVIVDDGTNTAPVVISPINDYTLPLGSRPRFLTLANVFGDADGDDLTYSLSSTPAEDSTVSLTSDVLTISAYQAGTVTHTVTANDGKGGLTDEVFVVTVTDGTSDFNQTIEAEEAYWSAGAVESDHSGYNFLGYVNTPNSAGQWLSFDIDIPQTDTYTLQVRYAHGGANNRAAEVEVDGAVQVANLDFNPTGAWSNWALAEVTLNLSAGVRNVRLNILSAEGAANIDQYTVLGGTPPELSVAPVAEYAFESSLSDARGNFGDGVSAGATIPATGGSISYTTGAVGDALYLNGASGVLLPDNLITGDTYSVSLWLNPDALTQFTTAFFGYTSETNWLSLVPHGVAEVNGNTMIWSGTNWFDAGLGQQIPVNTWSHLVLTAEAGQLTVYLNGSLAYSGPGLPDVFATGPSMFALGINYWDTPYQGAMDQLTLFDEVITQSDIDLLYQAGQ